MANDVRVKVTLSCTECKQRNYNTTKNKRNNPDRIEMMKYCKFCKKETLHRETKQLKEGHQNGRHNSKEVWIRRIP